MRQNNLGQQLAGLMTEVKSYLDLIAITPCNYTRNMLLYIIRQRLTLMESMIQNFPVITTSGPMTASILGTTGSMTAGSSNQRIITPEELNNANGENGKPAYVAINGLVYDVTNNAAWAAASHFGLRAGRDLSKEYSSCHQGQGIISRLPVVGRLI